MNWIAYSAIMFVGSVVYYLIVKKVQRIGVDKAIYMAANSLVPLVLYLILALIGGENFIMTPLSFIISIGTAFILNYIGTLAGYQAIKSAPNTGYSVIIQKSYAVYTSLVSVLLFGSELPGSKYLSILIIVLFTALIIIEKKKGEKFKIGKWVWLSFLAFFLFGGTTLAAKQVALNGDNPTVYLFWVMLFTVAISVFQLLRSPSLSKISKLPGKTILWLFFMSLAVSVFYWGKNQSTVTAPNVGYTGAINAASNAALTVASAIIYKEELKLLKLVGVVGVAAGLAMLIW